MSPGLGITEVDETQSMYAWMHSRALAPAMHRILIRILN